MNPTGLHALLDACQAIGQMQVDVTALGAISFRRPAANFCADRLGPWIPEIGGKMRPEKLSDPRKPRSRRNRITSADFWPFWAPGNRIDAKFGVPAEILGLERLTAKFALLQKPATSCWRTNAAGGVDEACNDVHSPGNGCISRRPAENRESVAERRRWSCRRCLTTAMCACWGATGS
jgi:hypothetical protein